MGGPDGGAFPAVRFFPSFDVEHMTDTLPAKKDAGEIDIGPVRLTAVGIQFTAAPTYEQWAAAMQWTNRCAGASQFWVGDLIVHGANQFGEEASQYYDKETTRRWAWVCEKVIPKVRRAALSFSHHEVVAKLPTREQDKFLSIAEAEGLSVKELKKLIKGEQDADDDKELCPTCGKSWDGIYKT